MGGKAKPTKHTTAEIKAKDKELKKAKKATDARSELLGRL